MRIQFILFVCLIGLAGICVMPVSASVADIAQGSTVFVGEEGLVLQPGVLAPNDSQVAWYPSGTTVSGTSVPDITLTIIPSSFDVTPVQFGGRTGAWYSYPNGVAQATPHLAFLVDQPEARVKLWVYPPGGGIGEDGTGYKTIRGVKLGFRMETNLYPIFNRPGVTAGEPGIDIYVDAPGGFTYSSLYDDASTPHSVPITGQHPQTAYAYVPIESGATCVWDTGNAEYNAGDYTFYAYADVNGLKNVVGRVEGDTFTLLATATESPGVTPTPESPDLITGTGTVTLDTTSGGIVQTDTLLNDPEGMAYISMEKGTRALDDKAQRLGTLSMIMVGDPQNIGPSPEGQNPLSTWHISPEGSSFFPSAELGILISDNSLSHNLYWWSESAGKWYVVHAETDDNDGYLKAEITKTGYYMMTYPSGMPTATPTAEPTILPEPTATAEPTASPTSIPTQTPLGFLSVLAGFGACTLLKKR
ncbi:DUF3821 domain-containing protein [Methanogenium organophilum]|uniref:DUF3821 domain-containing protein n=1 Tax=Methanogenium organophilum TaxID=2199 RepID=A0A9X9S320_METOG|nr:DUF3821 domain-containing protein [Methanogenium organophilum]WAI00598.1 DUF3821 domain-containing protein [Methanogenium organophilum]